MAHLKPVFVIEIPSTIITIVVIMVEGDFDHEHRLKMSILLNH